MAPLPPPFGNAYGNGNRRDKMTLRGSLHQKCHVKNYHKDRLSVCRMLLPQRKPKLGRMRAAGWT